MVPWTLTEEQRLNLTLLITAFVDNCALSCPVEKIAVSENSSLWGAFLPCHLLLSPKRVGEGSQVPPCQERWKTPAQEAGCATRYWVWSLDLCASLLTGTKDQVQGLCTRGKHLPMNHTASQVLGARALRDVVTQNPLCAASWRLIFALTRPRLHRGKQKGMYYSLKLQHKPHNFESTVLLRGSLHLAIRWLLADKVNVVLNTRNPLLSLFLKGETRGPLQAQKEGMTHLLQGKWSIWSPSIKPSPWFFSAKCT